MKEKKLYLILGSHAHVPSGASEKEFEYIYENRMRPFVSNLYRYSNIQAVLHYSGVLLYWVERTHPEFFMLIEDMVARKQAEILSGGFYEPMLALIPLQDRIGQIELMTTYLRRHFGKRPMGCWIPGMVWEQPLAWALASSDMQYTFLSQDQFAAAGLSGDELYFPCITEDQGKIVTVFPVSLSVQKELEENSLSGVFIELVNKMKDDNSFCEDRIITVFPEKPSSSVQEAPDTAWNRFFEELSLSKDIIETTLPAKILRVNKNFKKASFPNSSSIENNYSPRRFIIETCEANGIYSKMIFTNVLINQLRGDKARKQAAREELWKAQDYNLFVPGGGIKRNELRKAAYSSLLRAERLSRDKGRFILSLVQHDFDLDGVKEYLFQDAKINCCIQLKGAGIFELDYLPKDWNYLDCGANSCGQRRTAFADTLVPPSAKIKEIGNNVPLGSRLCYKEQFEAGAQDRKGKSCFKLPSLSSTEDIPFSSIEINKCYLLRRDVLTVNYLLKNNGKEKANFSFITEIDFSFAGKGEEFVRFYTTDTEGKDIPAERELTSKETLKIHDIKNEVQILINSAKPFSGCIVNACDEGLYQADRILTLFPVSLEPGDVWTNEFSLKFSH